MDQLAVSLFPLAYAGYAQLKIRNYKQVPHPTETIALRVKIGFQLQIVILQMIEVVIALLRKDLLTSLCSLFLIIGLFYSFGITVIYHNEPLLICLPLICLFNLVCNPIVLQPLDFFSTLLAILLIVYQHQKGNDPMAYNAFCEIFEQEDSFIGQYVVLLKFQPNQYQEEIELHEFNDPNIKDPLLSSTNHQANHAASHVAQFIINQTRGGAIQQDQKNQEPVIMDIVFSKDDDSDKYNIETKPQIIVQSQHNHNVRASQVIEEENYASDEKSYPSFKETKDQKNLIRKSQTNEKRSMSQREIQNILIINEETIQQRESIAKSDDAKIKKQPQLEQQQSDELENDSDKKNSKSDDQNLKIEIDNNIIEQFQPLNNIQIQERVSTKKQSQQKIVEIIDITKITPQESPLKVETIPKQQSYPFVEDEENPNKLIVIPQQIQQQLQKSKQQKLKKKQTDVNIIAKRNKMMKRIKSFEEFKEKNDDARSQNSDKKSDFEKYKDEASSATISEDESDSGVYVQQKMEKVQFQVGRQIIRKQVNYEVKTLIPINVKVKREEWVQNCQYVDLYSLANGHLPKPSYGDADIEKKFFFIQQWLDGMSQNPLLMRREILEYFNVPESVINKYGLIKKIEEEQRTLRLSNKYMNSTTKEYFQKIKKIQVECVSCEISKILAGTFTYKIRFTINQDKKQFISECNKTIDEIKECTKIIQSERNLRVTLQDHETNKKQMKAIDQFLQELFNHQFYYCDKLFEQFNLLDLIK